MKYESKDSWVVSPSTCLLNSNTVKQKTAGSMELICLFLDLNVHISIFSFNNEGHIHLISSFNNERS